MDNIYLIGMMGAGKTAVGRALAGELRKKSSAQPVTAVDLDREIAAQAGMEITAIFAQKGEAFFRELESRVLLQAAEKRAQVISTGGGIVLLPQNTAVMRRTGQVFYLDASPAVLWQRLKDQTDRPLLKTANPRVELEKILAQRRELYRQACHYAVDGNTSVETAVKDILKLLENKRA